MRRHTQQINALRDIAARLKADRFNADALRDFEALVSQMTQHERRELAAALRDMLRDAQTTNDSTR